MSVKDIVQLAYENDLYYATEFQREGRRVLVFTVYSKDGESNFKKQMKNYLVERVIDSHNENTLIGVMV